MSESRDLVLHFLDLLSGQRADEAVELLAPDVEWRNRGLPTLRGDRVAWALRQMERRGIRFTADMDHIVGEGEVVLTERIDHLHLGRWTSSFWVCGTFIVRDGRIVLWDDRFATGNVLLGSLRGLAGLLRR